MPNMPARPRPATAPLTSGRRAPRGANATAPAEEALDAPVGPLAPPAPVPGVSGVVLGFSSSPDMLGLHLPGLLGLAVLHRGGQQLELLALGAALRGQLGADRPERLVLGFLVELEERADEHLRGRRAAPPVHFY